VQETSSRVIPRLESVEVRIFSLAIGARSWPSRAGVELRVGTEECVVAADAAVESLVVQVVVLAGEGALGALLARDFKLQRGQLLFPLGVGLVDLGHLNGADFFPASVNWMMVTASDRPLRHGRLVRLWFEAGEQGSASQGHYGTTEKLTTIGHRFLRAYKQVGCAGSGKLRGALFAKCGKRACLEPRLPVSGFPLAMATATILITSWSSM